MTTKHIAALLVPAVSVITAAAGPVAASATTDPPPDPAATVQGLFDVGGHELYLSCIGVGEPTVVYLHGYSFEPGGGSDNAGPIPEMLADDVRVCVYDRANVGRSGTVDERQSGADSVDDLHALLKAAAVPGPYVLLGASFGGLLAYMYAGTYPAEVAGVVLLDPTMPDEPAWFEEWVPGGINIPVDEWTYTTEGVDWIPTYDEAVAVRDQIPPIPGTLIIPSHPEAPSDFPVEGTYAFQQMQVDMVDQFEPGLLVATDTPHYMEPEIPEIITLQVEATVAHIRTNH